MIAKVSTALTLIVGPVLDSTGAEYAGAAIGDLSISKNGGTLTALASAASLTYIANGQYTLVLTTGNTDTLGALQILCNKSTYQMPTVERQVVAAAVYDDLVSDAPPAEAAGRATTIRAMRRRVWEWVTNAMARDRSTGAMTLSNAAGNATLETRTQGTTSNVDSITKGV